MEFPLRCVVCCASSSAKTFKLLSLVESHPCTYNIYLADYANKFRKDVAFDEIAAKFRPSPVEITAEHIKAKLKSLRSQHSGETAWFTKNRQGSKKKTKKWAYYDAMNFLYSYKRTVEGLENFIDNAEDTVETELVSNDGDKDDDIDDEIGNSAIIEMELPLTQIIGSGVVSMTISWNRWPNGISMIRTRLFAKLKLIWPCILKSLRNQPHQHQPVAVHRQPRHQPVADHRQQHQQPVAVHRQLPYHQLRNEKKDPQTIKQLIFKQCSITTPNNLSAC